MGARGPRPKPTAVLRLRGSNRVGRHTGSGEPRPEAGRPRCPSWLDPYAKAAWKQLVPQLEAMGVLTRIDGHALVLLVQMWARWRQAEEFLIANGSTYPIRSESGEVTGFRSFPQVQIADKTGRALNRLFAEFGMTPSARSRIELASAEGAPPVIIGPRGKSRFFTGREAV